jgi:hypothetical protein
MSLDLNMGLLCPRVRVSLEYKLYNMLKLHGILVCPLWLDSLCSAVSSLFFTPDTFQYRPISTDLDV